MLWYAKWKHIKWYLAVLTKLPYPGALVLTPSNFHHTYWRLRRKKCFSPNFNLILTLGVGYLLDTSTNTSTRSLLFPPSPSHHFIPPTLIPTSNNHQIPSNRTIPKLQWFRLTSHEQHPNPRCHRLRDRNLRIPNM